MSVVARLFAGCLILVVLAVFVVGTVAYGVFRFSDAEPIRGAWSQPLDEATTLRATIDVNNGDVTVADSLPAAPVVGAGTAIQTEYVAGSNTPVDRDWQVVDGTGTAHLGSASTRPPAAFLGWLQSPEQAQWDVGLNPTVPVELGVDIAFGSARLDLTGLAVSRLDLNLAIGNADVVLGGTGGTTGHSRIRVGVGDVQLVVPEDVPVSIRVTAGAGSVQPGAGFTYDGMRYTNAAWQSNPDSGVELVVEAGTGNVALTALTRVTDRMAPDAPVATATPSAPVALPGLPTAPAVPTASAVPTSPTDPRGAGAGR